MLRKSIFLLACLLVLQSGLPYSVLAEPNVDATSAILIDGNTGKILWSKNPYIRRPIASTTKIMTGLLAIEKLSPEEVVTADSAAEKTSDSEIYLEENEKMTVNDLIYALMLQSANDAAVVLANQVSGSIPKFANLMNIKSKNMGLINSRFNNPHGLQDVNTSTAYDMAQLGRTALKNEAFASIVKTKTYTIKGKTKRNIINRNKLLWRYPYGIGIKTGYTKAAGYCLVSAAKKGSIFVVAATLNSATSDSSFNNAKNLFEYGFKQLKYFPIARKDEVKAKIGIPYSFVKMNLATNADFGVIAAKNTKIRTKIILKKIINLPIKKGETLGQIKVIEKGIVIARKDLKALKSAPEIDFLGRIGYWLKSTFRVVLPGIS